MDRLHKYVAQEPERFASYLDDAIKAGRIHTREDVIREFKAAFGTPQGHGANDTLTEKTINILLRTKNIRNALHTSELRADKTPKNLRPGTLKTTRRSLTLKQAVHRQSRLATAYRTLQSHHVKSYQGTSRRTYHATASSCSSTAW